MSPIQGGPSGSSLPFVDVKTKVLSHYGLLILKRDSQLHVNKNVAYNRMDHPAHSFVFCTQLESLLRHNVGVAVSAPEVDGSRVRGGEALELCERAQVGADPLMRNPDIRRN